MVVFNHEGTLSGAQSNFVSGLRDLEISQDGTRLYGAAEWGTGLAVWQVGGSLNPIDAINYSGATGTFSDLELVLADIDGQSTVLTLNAYNTEFQAYTLNGNGEYAGARPQITQSGATPVRPIDAVQQGDFLYVAQGSGGVAAYEIRNDGSLRFRAETGPDTFGGYVGGIDAVTVNGTEYVIGAFTNDDRIAAFSVAGNGAMTMTGQVSTQGGMGIDAPNLISITELGGQTFVIAGSYGSQTITVMTLNNNGSLSVTDHVLDTLDTRFGHISALEVVTHDGGVYILAGGPDDGISLLQLLPDGRLIHMVSVADATDTTLDNVTALAAVSHGNGLTIYAGSETEAGLSEFHVDLSTLGDVRVAANNGSTLSGTGRADTLMSGAGDDVLTGNGGADTFVVDADGSVDVITDYTVGQDVIDLSQVALLYGADQLTVIGQTGGAMLYFGDFELEVRSNNGNALRAQDITLETGLTHLQTGRVDAATGQVVFGTDGGDALIGGAGDDVMKGFSGNDRFVVGDGTDTIDGGDGFDMVSFENTTGRVLVDLENDVSNAGFARFFQFGHAVGSEYANVEAFEGGDYADNLRGDASANTLSGGGVSDRLYGRAGDDVLDGGAGADALYGNRGADTMTGGDNDRRDRFIFFNANESEAGAGNRDIITDFHHGEDRIEISRLDADLTQGFKQQFEFIGQSGFSGDAGELRYQQFNGSNMTLIQADLDGDRVADFEIELSGIVALDAGDFLI